MIDNYIWYVEPLDAATNRVIAQSLPAENACHNKGCDDGVSRDLWRCTHATVSHLTRSAKQLRLRFYIYVQQGQNGPVRRWAFENKGQKTAKSSTIHILLTSFPMAVD